MHYLSHESVDEKNGIIVDMAVTPGDTGDSEPCLSRMEYVREERGPDVEIVGAFEWPHD